jgi:hypothetical protein
VKRTGRRPRVKVTTGGRNVVSHVGARLLGDVAENVGLEAGLSVAMAPTKQRRRGHDRGGVLVDVAVMIADGGLRFSDLAVLADQPVLFGDVASVPTAWRALAAVDDQALERIAVARAAARAKAWAAGMDPGFYVIDIDATLIGAHSEKEHAAPTYKRGYGFHPLLAYLDATREPLAGLLRPGNAGSGTAEDHITVLDDALAQLPVAPADHEIIVRTDSAGLSHLFLEHCHQQDVRFIVGHPLKAPTAAVLVELNEAVWQPAVTADGADWRESGEICEITGLVDLSAWPDGTRMIARREQPHDGAQLTFTDVGGYRYQLCVTDLADDDVAYLEALYRGRGRCEQRICDAKATGLANLPSASFAINQAWLICVLIAQDLICWAQHLALHGELARAEPKRLRYCLFHVAAVTARTARRTIVRIAENWPWDRELAAAFARIANLPLRS